MVGVKIASVISRQLPIRLQHNNLNDNKIMLGSLRLDGFKLDEKKGGVLLTHALLPTVWFGLIYLRNSFSTML